MAHDRDFAGGSLRLSAFLRIVQSLPQRLPRRMRRAHSIAGDDHVPTPTPNHACTASPSRSGEVSSDPENGSEEDAPISVGGEVSPGPENKREEDTTAAPLRKPEPVLYTPKAPKADPRHHGPPSTTRKRRLPVNELALVRTTTADGLPDRSVHRKPSLLITETDPIEDSQMGHYCHLPNRISSTNKVSKPKSRMGSPRRQRTAAMPKWPTSGKSKQFQKPCTATGGSAILAPDTDAFVGTELSLPSKPRAIVVKPQQKHLVPARTTGLVLQSGYLPAPSASIELHQPETIAFTFELAAAKPRPAQGMLAHQRASTESQPAQSAQLRTSVHGSPRRLRKEQIISQLGASAQRRQRMSDEERIISQLSRVLAPTRSRTSTDSDTQSSSDEDETHSTIDSNGSVVSETNNDGVNQQGAHYEQRGTTDQFHHPQDTIFPPASSLRTIIDDTVYGPKYYASLNSGDNAFWSHYGGLE